MACESFEQDARIPMPHVHSSICRWQSIKGKKLELKQQFLLTLTTAQNEITIDTAETAPNYVTIVFQVLVFANNSQCLHIP